MEESLLTGAVQVFHFLAMRMAQKHGRTFSILPRKQVVASYPSTKKPARPVFSYAGWENRTPAYSLENCSSTIKLIPLSSTSETPSGPAPLSAEEDLRTA